MKAIRLFIFVLLLSTFNLNVALAQSEATEKLQKRYPDSRAFFFYNNTLRMINQQEDSEFDELIKDIEKMKLLLIKKDNKGFDYRKLVSEYKSDSFEEIMTSRHEGKSFDIYVKEKNGDTKAMLVLVNDDENLFVLDIVGKIAFDKVTKLYSVIDDSGDIGKRIQRFVEGDEKDKKENSTEAK